MAMTFGDVAALVAAGTLLTGLAAVLLAERRRSRRFLHTLHHETRGLCREASELAEAVCRHRLDGGAIDPAFMDRYALSEPQTYPGLVPSLWRLHPDSAAHIVEFHGQLAVARMRWAAWRARDPDPTSTYLLSALIRATHAGHFVLSHIERRLGWSERWTPHMPLASAFLDQAEHEDTEFLDYGYWSG